MQVMRRCAMGGLLNIATGVLQEMPPNQLVTKNPTEKIIDKDNHLRDCLKYLLLTTPNPAEKSWQMKAAEAIAPLAAAGGFTSAYCRYLEMEAEAEGSNRHIYWPPTH